MAPPIVTTAKRPGELERMIARASLAAQGQLPPGAALDEAMRGAMGARRASENDAIFGALVRGAIDPREWVKGAFASGQNVRRNVEKGNYGMAAGETALNVLPDVGPALAAALPAGKAGLLKRLAEKGYFKEVPNQAAYDAEKSALRQLLNERAVNDPWPAHVQGIQARDIMHSSRNLFSDLTLDPRVMSTGAGDQWQGWGSYLTGAAPVNQFYRDLTSEVRIVRELLNSPGYIGNVDKLEEAAARRVALAAKLQAGANRNNPAPTSMSYADIVGPYSQDVHRNLRQFGFPLDEASAKNSLVSERNFLTKDLDYLEKRRADLIADHLAMGRSMNVAKRDVDTYINRLRKDHIERYVDSDGKLRAAPLGRTVQLERAQSYSGRFWANEDELFNLNSPLQGQAAEERVRQAFSRFKAPSGIGTLDDWLDIQTQRLTPQEAYKWNAEVVADRMGMKKAMGPLATQPQEISAALLESGVVGNKYWTKLADPSNPTWNYVAFDPKRVRFEDLWALGPVGFGIAAQQDRQSSQSRP